MVVAVAFFGVGLTLPSPAFATHAEPLRAHWPLDSVQFLCGPDGLCNHPYTFDSSGHNLVASAAGVETVDDGRFDKALHFDGGSDESVEVPDSALLEPQQLTVMAWVRRSGSPGAYRKIVAKGGYGCEASSYELYAGTQPNQGIAFYVWNISVGYGGTAPTAVPESAVWDGQWHAIAGTYDGFTVRLYLDGTQVASAAYTGGIGYGFSYDDFTIGKYGNDAACSGGVGSTNYSGDIDDVRVYSNALTQQQIADIQFPSTGGGGGGGGDDGGGGGGGDDGGGGGGGDPGGGGGGDPGGGGGGDPGGGGGGGAGGARPPVATFVAAKSKTMKGALWLNAAGSTADRDLRIVNYEWTVENGPGFKQTFKGDCGGVGAFSIPLPRTGNWDVSVQVTDSAGGTDTFTQTVAVAQDQTNRAERTGAVYDCENPGANNQPDAADCVKTVAIGIAEVNGRGGPDQCFRIREIIESLSPPTYYYVASISGPVALNGMYLPIPSNTTTRYDSTGHGRIGIGTIDVKVGGYRLGSVDLSFDLPERKRGVRKELGYFDQEGSIPLFGGFKVGGTAGLALLDRKSEIKLGIRLPNIFSFGNKTALVEVVALSDNQRGLVLDGALIKVPHVFLGPLYVEDLFFSYRASEQLWEGGADVGVPGGLVKLDGTPPPPDFGIGIRAGGLDHLGAGVTFQPPAAPKLFPGIFLHHIGLAYGPNPFRLTGTIGITAGVNYELNGTVLMVFATPENPYDVPDDPGPHLAPLAGRTLDWYTLAMGGTVAIKVPRLITIPLVSGYLIYQYQDYFEWGGGFKYAISFLEVSGQVAGFLYPSEGKFSAEAGLRACLRNIEIPPGFDVNFCASVGTAVSSKGIGFCLLVPNPLPIGPSFIPAGAGYKWGDSLPDLMIFSCDYKQYAETASGAQVRAAQAGGFTVDGGLPAVTVRIIGNGGAPDAVVTGPKGERISTKDGTDDPNVYIYKVPESNATFVGIKNPSAGRWSVAAEQGSAPITSIATAEGRDEPKISASVTESGDKKVLEYKMDKSLAGDVTFYERGSRTARILGTTRKAKGRIEFAPGQGAGGKRKIVASVEQGGVPTDSLTVARYRAPRPRRLGKPERVRVKRRGSKVVARWRRVPGAALYYARLDLKRERMMVVSRRPRARFRGIERSVGGQVAVGAVDGRGAHGPELTAKLRARGKRR